MKQLHAKKKIEIIIEQIMAGVPANARIVVVGVCMQRDHIEPMFGINKELNLQFVLGYSGEEFGVILPETDSAAALRIIQGIASRFAAIRYQHDGRNFTCSFSAGIACSQFFPQEGQLINAAEKALYQAKVRGRDRVLIAQDGAIVE